MDEKEISRNIIFNPSVLLMNIEEDREEIEIFEKDFNDINDVKSFNDELISCIRKDYKSCIDLVKKSSNGSKYICTTYSTKRICFTHDLMEKVLDLYNRGLGKREIARLLGITKDTVYGILRYRGLR